MKKFIFAVQVFGIMAMFPLYVILEINHGLPENKNQSGVTEKPEKTITQASLSSKVQNENYIPGKILTASKDPLSKGEIKNVLVKAGYKAY